MHNPMRDRNCENGQERGEKENEWEKEGKREISFYSNDE